MHVLIRFLAIALPWLIFLIGVDAFFAPRAPGEPLFTAHRVLFLLLPIYAGVVVYVLKLTQEAGD